MGLSGLIVTRVHEPHESAPAVARIDAIEGLRGWLAFSVLAYHLLSATNVSAFYGFERAATALGGGAVDIFIMLSGCVIAGLLLQRDEPWAHFITQRAFRLFPAYWMALALGTLAMFLHLDAFAFMTWANSPLFAGDIAAHKANVETVLHQPVTATVLHLSLLQSAVPPALAPNEIQSILVPAWSLSLEWQFYLVAPVLVWMLRRRVWAFGLVAATLVMMKVFAHAPIDEWIAWASLPKCLHLFVIGILTRLALPHLRISGGRAWIIALAVLGFGLQFGAPPPVPAFLAFAILMIRQPDSRSAMQALDWLFDSAFKSRLAQWFGARSYSIYILHSPIIGIAAWAVLRLYPFSRLEALAVLGLLVAPVTIVASDFMYRYVEAPGIALGKGLVAGAREAGKRTRRAPPSPMAAP